MVEIDKKLFDDFFEEVSEIDKKQLDENLYALKMFALTFIPCGILWFLIVYFIFYKLDPSFFCLILSFFGFFITIIIFLCFCFAPIRLSWYHDTLFKYFGFKYVFDDNTKSTITNKMKSICINAKLVSPKSEFITDEIIEGKYNELPYQIMDVKISKTNFHGFILATKINKNFKGNTFIKSDKLFKTTNINDMERVTLEDIAFEKNFDVYSNNQIEARYVLTTSFMDRLLNYQHLKNCNIEIYFSNNIDNDYNILIFVNTGKNDFEFKYTPMGKLIEKDVFYNTIQEIYNVFDVVEALKLEQNIGL